MRVPFKTGYDHDIRLFRDRFHALRYALLVALAVALPFLIDDFLIGEATSVLIWAIAGMGLMLLTGHAGQPSLGHAAFLAAGCYAHAILMTRFGLPFLARPSPWRGSSPGLPACSSRSPSSGSRGSTSPSPRWPCRC